MAGHMLILGMGYTGARLADALRERGWRVTGVKRGTGGPDVIAFDDQAAVLSGIAGASHILSSVPPARDGADPVLARYGPAIATAPACWVGYLSSTGVYGDTGGAWVDESAPIGLGRRTARAQADGEWQALRPDMRIFRLPGIYGPGRSALDRVRDGKAHRIAIEGQVFSRIHVDDIVSAVVGSFSAPAGIYNIADDHPCAQNDVISYASGLLNVPLPPLQSLEEADLSPMAQGFYAENRRIANGRAKRVLNWSPLYPDFRSGLQACFDNAPSTPYAPSGKR